MASDLVRDIATLKPWMFILIFTTELILALPTDSYGATINVGTTNELQNAVSTANSTGGNTTILLRDGTYTLTGMLNITAPGVTIASQSGARDKVIIQGDAMSSNASVKILLRVTGSNFQVRDLTLQKCGWHLVQIVGEENADHASIRNVIFRDAYEQLLKVTVDQNNYSISSDNGLVENSLFEYSAGIGPQYYIGGIDVHSGKNWIVRNNTFRSIISPNQSIAEFAIHFWNQSADALVEKNTIVDCDRGIGFGLDSRGNSRGIIRNNMIYHSANNGQFADVGIYLDQSPGTQVYNNSIIMENSYPYAIEYRFAQTANVLIVNNLTNKQIVARDGATGSAQSNLVNASTSWFVNPSIGNLHLASPNSNVIDKGQAVNGLLDDFDGTSRPQGSAIDIGAIEWLATPPTIAPPHNLRPVP